MSDDTQESERVLRDMMLERAAQQHQVISLTTIDPARRQIIKEHHVGVSDLTRLVTASLFVPPGREEVFALGLAAGFNGEFITALHVLMPQVEHAIRMVLAQQGAMTSKIDEEGVQDERSLNELLYCDVARRAFGTDLLFEMQGLLVERFGGNLRNRTAHGLLDVDHMYSWQSVYFWWLTLHLVVRPQLQRGEEEPLDRSQLQKDEEESPLSSGHPGSVE